jgi:hypothetical protein
VTFAGAVTEERLYELYADADVVSMPSRYESFGLVLVEGMMFGKPVVGCAVGGMCEIVEPGANGYLAVPGDAASLADCLERLIESEELRAAFGQRSRVLYEQKYALPIVVENTLRYYREVSERHKSAPPAAVGMAARLAEVIAEAVGVPPEAAARAAARLLDSSCFPVDHLMQVRKLWQLPPEEFLKGLYPLLLKREIDTEGQRHFLKGLRGGMPRGEVVRHLALSDEARAAGLLTAWLGESPAPPRGSLLRRVYRRGRRILGKIARRLGLRRGASAASAGEGVRMNFQPVPEAPRGRFARLRSLLSPKRAVRYVKRLILLPWNFQKVYDEQVGRKVDDTRKELRELIERHALRITERMETATSELTKELTKDMRQLRYRFAEFYGALVEELRRQADRLDELAAALQQPVGQQPRGRAA